MPIQLGSPFPSTRSDQISSGFLAHDYGYSSRMPSAGKSGQTEMTLREADLSGITPTRLHQGHFRLS
jgi:hypothetical protein